MLVDFAKEIINREGVPMKNGERPDAKNVTLGFICTFVLDADWYQGQDAPERRPNHEEKLKRGKLADRIFDAKEPIDLKSEEITLIKTLISYGYPPFVVTRTSALLDPEVEKK